MDYIVDCLVQLWQGFTPGAHSSVPLVLAWLYSLLKGFPVTVRSRTNLWVYFLKYPKLVIKKPENGSHSHPHFTHFDMFV